MFVFGEPLNATDNKLYKQEEVLLARRIMRYWTNFAKTGMKLFSYHNKKKENFYFKGNPNEPNHLSIHWPLYEKINKSYINFHAQNPIWCTFAHKYLICNSTAKTFLI